MSVLQRKELEQSPLADLHAIASELAIEGYRSRRREELISAILNAQGGDDPGPAGSEGEERSGGDGQREEAPRPRRRPRVRRQRKEATSDGELAEVAPGPDAAEGEIAEPEPARAGEVEPVEAGDVEQDGAGDAEPAGLEAEGEVVVGVLDVLSGGSGFVRPGSSEDVYVSPAQIRRCELRAGDEVGGPVRPARRNERHASLVRVETVNGRPAEPPEQRPHFDELTPVHATERLPVPAAVEGVPFGKGSRVAIAGAPGAGATRLLRDIVAGLTASQGLEVSVVLVGARPEEVTDWRRQAGAKVSGGGFDGSLEAQAQAAELAVERAKRLVERGGDVVVVVDSLASLGAGVVRRVFGAARNVEAGGSLTVIAAAGTASETQRQASTRIVLEPAGAGGEPRVSESSSGTLRADLLG